MRRHEGKVYHGSRKTLRLLVAHRQQNGCDASGWLDSRAQYRVYQVRLASRLRPGKPEEAAHECGFGDHLGALNRDHSRFAW